MTKRDFLILLIKIFGLFSFIGGLFSSLPSNLIYAVQYGNMESIAYLVVAFIILFVIFILFVFYADRVVSLLRLDRGFDDERIELGNLNGSDVVKIGTFIIGGLLIIEGIPSFLIQSYFSVKFTIGDVDVELKDKVYLATSALKILLGFFLIMNPHWVAKLFEGRKKGTVDLRL